MDIRPRPVVQIQIDLIDPEIAESGFQRGRDILRVHVAVPEFSRDEQLLARLDISALDRFADEVFILVGAGGVQVTPTEADGLDRGVFHQRLRPVGMEGAISRHGHFAAGGEFDFANSFGGDSLGGLVRHGE